MPSSKPHLETLFRTHPVEGRTGYLRLDMNESVVPLPEDFIRNALQEIDGNFWISA